MSMSTSVIGIREPDDQWKIYKEIIDTLERAGLSWEDAPERVKIFFGWEAPNEKGIEIDLREHESITPLNEDMVDGFSIDISKLPDNITHIQFRNCH